MGNETPRAMKVRHSVEDGEHVVRIYTPNSDYVYRHARWPVDEIESIEAIRLGLLDASEWAEWFETEWISVYSKDTAAMERFNDELNGGSE